MKTQKNIFIAFMLNLIFALAEFIGGGLTGSVAIISDSLHDFGDALSIGLSFFLEKKSRQKPDGAYTYGYGRYSVAGSLVTTSILLAGSVGVSINAVRRIISPSEIDYDGMLILAIAGVAVNLLGAFFTREGDSLNQKAVNLHMLEDVLGWVVVLIGALVMRFTDIKIIDPLMSIGVAVFIFVSGIKNLVSSLRVFLEGVPEGTDVAEIEAALLSTEGVTDVHHIHLWSISGSDRFATMHIVTDGDAVKVKAQVKKILSELGIGHSTIETESPDEKCLMKECTADLCGHGHHHHHGHHHGHHHHH